jgi:hypothetical protein
MPGFTSNIGTPGTTPPANGVAECAGCSSSEGPWPALSLPVTETLAYLIGGFGSTVGLLSITLGVVERIPGAGNIPSRWVWLVVFDKIREASPASRASLPMCGSLRIVDLRDENLSVPHDDGSVQMGWSEWVPLLSTQQASDNRSVGIG